MCHNRICWVWHSWRMEDHAVFSFSSESRQTKEHCLRNQKHVTFRSKMRTFTWNPSLVHRTMKVLIVIISTWVCHQNLQPWTWTWIWLYQKHHHCHLKVLLIHHGQHLMNPAFHTLSWLLKLFSCCSSAIKFEADCDTSFGIDQCIDSKLHSRKSMASSCKLWSTLGS